MTDTEELAELRTRVREFIAADHADIPTEETDVGTK